MIWILHPKSSTYTWRGNEGLGKNPKVKALEKSKMDDLLIYGSIFDRVEILCHDINVHIPHHISPRIPSYNLRDAHQSLQENWGKV